MCEFLEVSRSLVYYHLNKEPSAFPKEEEIIQEHIKEIFRLSRNNYGTRKIKVELKKLGYLTPVEYRELSTLELAG